MSGRASQALILLVVLLSGQMTVADDQPGHRRRLIDESARTACGPIGCYVAARALGVDVALETCIDRCGWSPGRRVSLAAIVDAIDETPHLRSQAARMNPGELHELLQGEKCAVILAVRSDGEAIDHVIVAIGATEENVTVIDYPQLGDQITLDELADRWDGAAIVVMHESPTPSRSMLAAMPVTSGLVVVLAMVVVARAVRSRRENQIPAASRGDSP